MNWLMESILKRKYPNSTLNEENGKVSTDVGELLLRAIRDRIVMALWSIALLVSLVFMSILAYTEGLDQESCILLLLTAPALGWCFWNFNVVFELLKGE